MQLIVTDTVYRLLAMETSDGARRRFLCQVYLEAEGGEPSWALREATGDEDGIKLEYANVTLWCTAEDKVLLDGHILLKDSNRGLVTVPSVVFHG